MPLHVYTVHLPPAKGLRGDAGDPLPQLVKEGFSWPAFLFGFAWALGSRLWIVAAALLALSLALGVVFEELNLDGLTASLVFFGIAVIVGFLGNDWRRMALRRRGYRDSGVVTAGDMETAIRRFLDLQSIEALAALRASAAGPAEAAKPWRSPDAGPWGAA
ncbi:MAG TPA: DUF2628 domain-containing protein [Alphaproteobacteria bacterium]|jgi:hypothetical protein